MDITTLYTVVIFWSLPNMSGTGETKICTAGPYTSEFVERLALNVASGNVDKSSLPKGAIPEGGEITADACLWLTEK